MPADGLSKPFESFEVKPEIDVVMNEAFSCEDNSNWPFPV